MNGMLPNGFFATNSGALAAPGTMMSMGTSSYGVFVSTSVISTFCANGEMKWA
jgi:hypothetical protein